MVDFRVCACMVLLKVGERDVCLSRPVRVESSSPLHCIAGNHIGRHVASVLPSPTPLQYDSTFKTRQALARSRTVIVRHNAHASRGEVQSVPLRFQTLYC